MDHLNQAPRRAIAVGAVSRWQASGIHLLLSAAIALAALALMLGLWYPGPLFEAAGGNDLLFILVGVDVVIGPLITLVVFKSKKPGLKLDLTVIAVLQIVALAYGCSIVYLARPAYIVFVKDRFEVASVVDIEPEELAAGRYPEFRRPALNGPVFAVADIPDDPVERNKVVEAAMAGLDMQSFPRYWARYGERTSAVLARAQTIAQLRASDPAAARAVDEYLARSGTNESGVRYLALRARRAWVAVLVDATTAVPVRMLIAEKI